MRTVGTRAAEIVLLLAAVPALAGGGSAPLTTPEEFASMAWSTEFDGAPLDMEGFVLTFEDEFDSLASVAQDDLFVATAPSGTKWFSPGHGAAPKTGWLGPNQKPRVFSIHREGGNSYLSIHQIFDQTANRWVSGSLQTVDKRGDGFTQQYGYFEARMRFPDATKEPVQGLWPAFWTYTITRYRDKTQRMVEYDIIEAYGGVAGDTTNRQVHTSAHLVPAQQPSADSPALAKRRHKSRIRKMPTALFDGQWHTYGGLVTPNWVVTYMDRKEVARFRTIPEARQPRYLLLDLDDAKGLAPPGPYRIDVDRVSVWALPAR